MIHGERRKDLDRLIESVLASEVMHPVHFGKSVHTLSVTRNDVAQVPSIKKKLGTRLRCPLPQGTVCENNSTRRDMRVGTKMSRLVGTCVTRANK